MPEDNQELLLFTGSSLRRPLSLVVNPGKPSHDPPTGKQREAGTHPTDGSVGKMELREG